MTRHFGALSTFFERTDPPSLSLSLSLSEEETLKRPSTEERIKLILRIVLRRVNNKKCRPKMQPQFLQKEIGFVNCFL